MVVGGTSKTSLVVVRPTEDDASTRDAVAAELRAEHQRLEFLLSATSAVTYSCQITAPFGATFVSENVTAILGYTAGEFIGDPRFWESRIHPHDRERILLGVPAVFRAGRQASTCLS